jgi:hypothetical protein
MHKCACARIRTQAHALAGLDARRGWCRNALNISLQGPGYPGLLLTVLIFGFRVRQGTTSMLRKKQFVHVSPNEMTYKQEKHSITQSQHTCFERPRPSPPSDCMLLGQVHGPLDRSTPVVHTQEKVLLSLLGAQPAMQ